MFQPTSTEAFVGMVCLITVRPSLSVQTGRLVLLLLDIPDMYRLLDPSVHSVAFSVDDFGLIPICDVVERDSMICDC